ncbi:MAG: helix-turn-helix domain-containing protein [Caldilinea sp. CFX5]|nr:helix-turn-helix domain-containing protein [Caldilinea sp. CFX5]
MTPPHHRQSARQSGRQRSSAPPEETPSFGVWLRQRRRALDLTQEALAQKIGCARITIRRIEADELKPSQQLAELFATHLAIPPNERTAFLRLARGLPDRSLQEATAAYHPLSTPPFLPPDSADQPGINTFVGRTRELTALAAALDLARSGQGQLRFVIGEAGRGKSTLLQAFVRTAQQQDATLLVCGGSCSAYTGISDPYLPLREALTMLTGAVESRWAGGPMTAEHAHQLWAAMPLTIPVLVNHAPDLIGSFVPVEPLYARATTFAPPYAPWLHSLAKRRQAEPTARLTEKQIFAQSTTLLKTIAAERPLVLLLEDLHWVDHASCGLLFHLSRTLRDSRVLIVGAYRPEELSITMRGETHPLAMLVGEFKRQQGNIWLDLDQVTPPEGRAFIDAYLDTQPNHLDQRFRAALFQRTGGHALFTVELLRAMQEQGELRQDDAGIWLAGAAVAWQNLPVRIEGVIGQRLERLPSSLQRVLTVASIEGETFTVELVARVLGWAVHELVQQLGEELDRRHRLIMPVSQEEVGQQRLTRYCFRHQLFQHYLYQRLDNPERTYLHEAIGYALEAFVQPQTEPFAVPLAHHFTQAGLPAKAVTYLSQAGNNAQRLGAHTAAIQYLQAGLTLLATVPDADQQIHQDLALQLSLANTLSSAKGSGAAAVGDAYRRAHQLCHQVGETAAWVGVLNGLRNYHSIRGEWAETRAVCKEMLQLAYQQTDPIHQVAAHRSLGNTLVWLGAFADARQHLEQGVARYDRRQHTQYVQWYGQDLGVACLTNLLNTLWLLGYPDQALARSNEVLTLAETLDHPLSLTYAYVWKAQLHWLRREPQHAQRLAETTMQMTMSYTSPLWWAVAACVRGMALISQGQVDAGIDQLQQGFQSYRNCGATAGLAFSLMALAVGYSQLGQATQGLQVLTEALATLGEEACWLAEIYRLQGELRLQQTEQTASAPADVEAEALFTQAIDLARRQAAKSFELRATMSLCRLWQTQGRGEEARQQLATIYGWFTEGFATPDLLEARTLLNAG